jgi:hypothetical protein
MRNSPDGAGDGAHVLLRDIFVRLLVNFDAVDIGAVQCWR